MIFLGSSKIEAYRRTRCAYKSVGENTRSLHEHAFMITCCEMYIDSAEIVLSSDSECIQAYTTAESETHFSYFPVIHTLPEW
jgi:hypothetical protein